MEDSPGLGGWAAQPNSYNSRALREDLLEECAEQVREQQGRAKNVESRDELQHEEDRGYKMTGVRKY